MLRDQLLLVLALLSLGSACQLGHKLPVVGECGSYLECNSSGIYTKYKCEYSQSFDPLSQSCKYAWSVKCVDAGVPCTKAGTNVPFPGDCSRYFECGANNQYTIKSCGSFQNFDVTTSSCRIKSNVNCSLTPQCSGNAMVPLDGYCKTYRQCVNGNWSIGECSSLHYLDITKNECSISLFGDHDCGDEVHCNFGPKEPVPGDCTSYAECTGKSFATFSCGFLKRFDPKTKECTWRWKVDCLNIGCANFDIQPSTDSTKFFACLDGQYQELDCGTEDGKQRYYDVLTKKCDTETTAFKGKCDPKSPLLPADGFCWLYLECWGGKYMLRKCGSGEMFDSTAQKCTATWGSVCTPNQTYCGKEYISVPDPFDCSAYWECRHGIMKRSRCGLPGYVFDADTNTCKPASLATCWPYKH